MSAPWRGDQRTRALSATPIPQALGAAPYWLTAAPDLPLAMSSLPTASLSQPCHLSSTFTPLTGLESFSAKRSRTCSHKCTSTGHKASSKTIIPARGGRRRAVMCVFTCKDSISAGEAKKEAEAEARLRSIACKKRHTMGILHPTTDPPLWGVWSVSGGAGAEACRAVLCQNDGERRRRPGECSATMHSPG